MIIAVGFKVNNERAVQFRKWANTINLKEYNSFYPTVTSSVSSQVFVQVSPQLTQVKSQW